MWKVEQSDRIPVLSLCKTGEPSANAIQRDRTVLTGLQITSKPGMLTCGTSDHSYKVAHEDSVNISVPSTVNLEPLLRVSCETGSQPRVLLNQKKVNIFQKTYHLPEKSRLHGHSVGLSHYLIGSFNKNTLCSLKSSALNSMASFRNVKICKYLPSLVFNQHSRTLFISLIFSLHPSTVPILTMKWDTVRRTCSFCPI